ncbi:hypothetical protein [Novosphingobium sp.]|uniref:hypothetical protein n=1 Tax=Novosphingobium sp. TaxID=1874826 RepID=UPI0025F7786C|nr:hypothetical protein [Novosphingobium sp.]
MFTQSLPNAPAMIFAASALAGLVVVAFAALKGWQGWLDLKARELDTRQGHAHEPGTHYGSGPGSGAARIEMADLRERVRKLEAIASGVDL